MYIQKYYNVQIEATIVQQKLITEKGQYYIHIMQLKKWWTAIISVLILLLCAGYYSILYVIIIFTYKPKFNAQK